MALNTDVPQSKLHALLCEERQLLQQFLLVTQEQAQLIAQEDEAALSHNLEKRQDIISRVDDVLTRLTPLWQDHIAAPYQEPGLYDMQKEIGQIVQETTAIDQKNQQVLYERIDFLRGQLRRVSETRRSAETYIKGAEFFPAGYVDEVQ